MFLDFALISQYFPRLLGVSVKDKESREKLATMYFPPRDYEKVTAADTAQALTGLIVDGLDDLSGQLGQSCIYDSRDLRDKILRPALGSSMKLYPRGDIEDAMGEVTEEFVALHKELPVERMTVAAYVEMASGKDQEQNDYGRQYG